MRLTTNTLLATLAATSSLHFHLALALPAQNQQGLAVAAGPVLATAAQAPSKHLYSKVSPDGTCGGETHFTCLGSRFGDCCSAYGYW